MEVLAAADLTWPNFLGDEFSVEDLLVDDEPEQGEGFDLDAESADSSEKRKQASSVSASLEPHSPVELDLIHHNEDVAELEWVSRFVDDSYFEYPETEHRISPATDLLRVAVPVRPRSKRPRATSRRDGLWSEREARNERKKRRGRKKKRRAQSERRCSHCGAEKTPQWRAGPMGAKTLCNACGVRFKSGRLLPEYRPASSPSFVSSVHSNSHRKVLEMRRKKEDGEHLQPLGFC